MSQRRARLFVLFSASTFLTATVACTSLLGDFEIVEDAGPTTQPESGAPDSPTTDAPVSNDAPIDNAQPPIGFTASFIAAGQNHTCAVKPPGHVYCWGNNDHGQLGAPPALTPGGKSNKPLKIPNFGQGVGPGTEITHVFVGGTHSCAIDANKALWCWGANENGQLGTAAAPDNTAHDRPTRVKGIGTIATLNGVAWASIGVTHTCAVLDSGEVDCWGSNADGETTAPVAAPKNEPVKVPSVTAATFVSAGPKHTCALSRSAATVWCWGRNQQGEIGVDAGANAIVPPSVVSFGATPSFVSAGGDRHTCAVAGSPSQIFCFGGNDMGQLGVNGVTSTSTPQPVPSPASGGVTFDQIHTRGRTTCARTSPDSNAPIACWGANDHGQLGQNTKDGVPHSSPAPVPGAAVVSVRELSVGSEHACAIVKQKDAVGSAGPVFCWGSGAFGKLGVDPSSISDEPAPKPVILE